MTHWSLRQKIFSWAFIPSAIIMVAVGLSLYVANQRVTETLVIARDQELARLTATELASSLEEYPGLLSDIARDMSPPDDRPESLQRSLGFQSTRLSLFDGGTVVLNNIGRVVAASPARPDIIGQDWSRRPFFRTFIQNPSRPIYSEVLRDGPDGEEVVALTVPVYDQSDRLAGALVGFFRVGHGVVNPMYGTLLRLRLDEKGTAYVVDERGNIVYASAPWDVTTDFTTHPVATAALAGNIGAQRTQSVDERPILASYSPVPGSFWRLVIEEDWASLMDASLSYRVPVALLLALGVLIPALLAGIATNRITRPLLDVIEASKEVARGDFGRTIKAPTGDEIETLAEQFNNMSAELQASYTQLEQRVEDRTRELSTVLAVSRDVASTLELQPLLAAILDQLRDVVDYRFARLFIMERGELALLEERGDSGGLGAAACLVDLPETDEMLASGLPMLVPNMQAETPVTGRLRDVAAEHGQAEMFASVGSFLSLPLVARDKSVGMMNLGHDQPDYYTPQRAEVAMAFAAQAAVAIENARLFATEQRRADQFRTINELSQTIASILDVDTLLQATAELIHQRFGYYHVGVGLVEGDVVRYMAGAGNLWEARQARFTPNTLRVGKEGLTGWVAASGVPALVPDVSRDPRYIALQGLSTRSELVVPIKSKDVVTGVIDLQSEIINDFEQSDLDIMQSLAAQLGVAIENARLYEQAGQLAAIEERQKLARELHDSVSQALYGIALGTKTARAVLEKAPVNPDVAGALSEPLDYVLSQADAGMAEMRALIFELRPESLQTEGLIAALRKQVAALQARHQMPVDTRLMDEPELPLAQKEMLYRVAQEAMHNIVKHSRATTAEVNLRQENGKVILEVCDNGQGFDMTQEFPGHLGLKSMRERVEHAGGQLTIASAVGDGTRIQVKLGPQPNGERA